MKSAEVAQTAGEKRSAYVRRSLRYGQHDLLPQRAQMLRTVTEVQVTKVGLGFGERCKHSLREREKELNVFFIQEHIIDTDRQNYRDHTCTVLHLQYLLPLVSVCATGL